MQVSEFPMFHLFAAGAGSANSGGTKEMAGAVEIPDQYLRRVRNAEVRLAAFAASGGDVYAAGMDADDGGPVPGIPRSVLNTLGDVMY